MFGPTSRLLRSTGAFLGFAFAVTGCQSVTQQKAAWSFPPFREEVDDRPIVTVEDRALPPLPTDYEKWVKFQSPPSSKEQPVPVDSKPNLASSRLNLPLQDASIVRASAIPAPTDTKPSASVENRFASTAGMPQSRAAVVPVDRSLEAVAKPVFPVSETNVGTKATSFVPGTAGAVVAPIEPPPAQPVPLDPKSTHQIVKRIVGASDDLIRTSAEAEDDDPILPALARPLLNQGQREVTETPIAAAVRPDSAGANAARSRPVRPPLETIPAEAAEIVSDRSKAAPQKPALSIPRAAICKSVEGRGRFEALPEQARIPGSPMIVYWEMDKLTREKTGQKVAFTALVELVSTDRDEILASTRETVRETGPEPAEGDFAALRWRIPPDLASGDYRIRISVTEESTRQTATTQLEFPVGRPPVASRFLLP